MTKIFILSLLLLMPFYGISQTNSDIDEVKVEILSIEVNIDSVEEIDTIFKEEDLEELFKMTEADEAITLSLKCNFKTTKDNLKGQLTYTIKGKANEKEKLITDIKKAKATALKVYNYINKR